MSHEAPKRVVVTGMGLVSPVGNDLQTTWDQLLAGTSGGGPITHFDANIYGAISGFTEADVTTANGEYEDNTYGWLYQLAKSFVVTGNTTAVLAQKERIPAAIAHAASLITSEKFHIPGPASNTYDDFWELPLDTYVASMYPMVMHSSAILARAIVTRTNILLRFWQRCSDDLKAMRLARPAPRCSWRNSRGAPPAAPSTRTRRRRSPRGTAAWSTAA